MNLLHRGIEYALIKFKKSEVLRNFLYLYQVTILGPQ